MPRQVSPQGVEHTYKVKKVARPASTNEGENGDDDFGIGLGQEAEPSNSQDCRQMLEYVCLFVDM